MTRITTTKGNLEAGRESKGSLGAAGGENGSKRGQQLDHFLDSDHILSNKTKWYGAAGPGGPDLEGLPAKGNHEEDGCTVANIIGNFGWFQLLVLIFSGMREGAVGYDAVVMSVVLQPERDFYCAEQDLQHHQVSMSHGLLRGNTTFNETAQCFLTSDGNSVACESWVFPRVGHRAGESMVADWLLVCDKHWLVAFIESAYFFGLVTGNLVWGYYADKLGRRKTYLISHFLALLGGWAAVFAPSVELFALCRYLSAFGAIGYNVIYSLQVELIGTKYRAFSTTLNHFGWGLCVICVPLVNHYFSQYRYIIAMAPALTLLMFPMAFWLPESPRWLMANGDHARAKQELYKAARFNGKRITPTTDIKIDALRQRISGEKMKLEAEGNKKSYQLLFSNPKLVRDTVILAYASFTGHLFYYLLTINFAYLKNLSIEANFITSGAGEWVSVLVGAMLLKFFSRRTCMSVFAFLMSGSFIMQCVIDSGLGARFDTPTIVTTINGIGTLSALLLVFVVLIVNQEVYPTVIRQTGSSIVNTIGESGSTLAPMLLQLARVIGLWRADLIYASACAVAMVGVQFITKTDDMELQDT